MGLFHCPIGAAYYDDDTCIDCGLCNANTSAEKVEASRKIREYIRSHTARDVRVSKVAVCGKGGAGKSTVTALLAQAFVEAGYSVIVLDSDDSNPCLGRMLGIDNMPAALGGLFSEQPPGNNQVNTLGVDNGPYINDIPNGYVKARDGISFMLTGKIFDPFQGCSCSMAESARRIVEKLRIRDREVLILDTEAGVESFGRGVERNVDTVLAVVEPSFGSIELAGRITSMAQGMGISRIGAILNKTVSDDMSARITQQLLEKGVTVFGAINNSRLLMEASFEGKPLLLQSDEVAHGVLRGIVSRLTVAGVSTGVQ